MSNIEHTSQIFLVYLLLLVTEILNGTSYSNLYVL